MLYIYLHAFLNEDHLQWAFPHWENTKYCIWSRYSCVHHSCRYKNTSWGVLMPKKIIRLILCMYFNMSLLGELCVTKISDLVVSLFTTTAFIHISQTPRAIERLPVWGSLQRENKFWLIARDFVVGSKIAEEHLWLFFILHLMPAAQHAVCVLIASLLQLATVTDSSGNYRRQALFITRAGDVRPQ